MMGAVEDLSLTTAGGDLLPVEGGGGRQLLDASLVDFWGIINAQPNPASNGYGFVRCDDGMSGGFPAQNGTTESGDGSTLIAWEVSGNLNVPTDGSAKVRLFRNQLGSGYSFKHNSGRCPGDSNDPWIQIPPTYVDADSNLIVTYAQAGITTDAQGASRLCLYNQTPAFVGPWCCGEASGGGCCDNPEELPAVIYCKIILCPNSLISGGTYILQLFQVAPGLMLWSGSMTASGWCSNTSALIQVRLFCNQDGPGFVISTPLQGGNDGGVCAVQGECGNIPCLGSDGLCVAGTFNSIVPIVCEPSCLGGDWDGCAWFSDEESFANCGDTSGCTCGGSGSGSGSGSGGGGSGGTCCETAGSTLTQNAIISNVVTFPSGCAASYCNDPSLTDGGTVTFNGQCNGGGEGIISSVICESAYDVIVNNGSISVTTGPTGGTVTVVSGSCAGNVISTVFNVVGATVGPGCTANFTVTM